jgi:branched-subunit amino acid ABC-type transport system permease component
MGAHALLGANLHLTPSYTVIGIVLGGVYALAAVGLVLIYRVSGVLNFAHGAVAMFATFTAYEVSTVRGAPGWVGALVAIVTGAALGFAIEWLTIRPLHGRPALVKVVVTIGWLLVLQTAAGLIWGATAYHQPVRLVSKNGFHLMGTGESSVTVGYDQLTTVVVALVFALAVAALLRYTTLGNAMRAVADNPDTARLWGISVNRVTAASWMVGSAMAAVAGVLITPLIAFDTFSLTVVVIYAFTAALIGRLSSLPMTVVGGFLLGLAQTYPRMFSSLSGTADLVTFALVLLTLGVLFRPGGRRVRVV